MTTVSTARTPCQDLTDPDRFFGNALEQRRVRHICAPCPVRLQCLVRALELRVDDGLWGGMTHAERQALRRRHPETDDWQTFLFGNLLKSAGQENHT